MRIAVAGTSSHASVDAEMRRLQEKRQKDQIRDVILLLSHPEIVTIGRRSVKDGVEVPDQYRTIEVDRGGGITWHGPGQIVIYPIIKWARIGESAVNVVIHRLEQWAIKALAHVGIEAHRDERMQGIWVDGSKIGSIGLAFMKWVSRHGMTLNLATPLGRVEGITGCGLDAGTTTSLSALGYEVEQTEIIDALVSTVEATLHRKLEAELCLEGEPPWDVLAPLD